VVVDGGRAKEQLRGDVAIAVPLADQAGDAGFLLRELGSGIRDPLADASAGRHQVRPGPFGECLGAHRIEHLVRDA
jgi:hypothetical protein